MLASPLPDAADPAAGAGAGATSDAGDPLWHAAHVLTLFDALDARRDGGVDLAEFVTSLVGAPAHDPRGAAATYTYGSSAAPGAGWTPASAGGGSGAGPSAGGSGSGRHAPFLYQPYQPRGAYMGGGSGSGGRAGRGSDGGGGPDPPPPPARGGGPAALSLAAAAVDALACLVPDPDAPDAAARVAEAAEAGLGVPVREAAVATLLSWRDRLF